MKNTDTIILFITQGYVYFREIGFMKQPQKLFAIEDQNLDISWITEYSKIQLIKKIANYGVIDHINAFENDNGDLIFMFLGETSTYQINIGNDQDMDHSGTYRLNENNIDDVKPLFTIRNPKVLDAIIRHQFYLFIDGNKGYINESKKIHIFDVDNHCGDRLFYVCSPINKCKVDPKHGIEFYSHKGDRFFKNGDSVQYLPCENKDFSSANIQGLADFMISKVNLESQYKLATISLDLVKKATSIHFKYGKVHLTMKKDDEVVTLDCDSNVDFQVQSKYSSLELSGGKSNQVSFYYNPESKNVQVVNATSKATYQSFVIGDKDITKKAKADHENQVTAKPKTNNIQPRPKNNIQPKSKPMNTQPLIDQITSIYDFQPSTNQDVQTILDNIILHDKEDKLTELIQEYGLSKIVNEIKEYCTNDESVTQEPQSTITQELEAINLESNNQQENIQETTTTIEKTIDKSLQDTNNMIYELSQVVDNHNDSKSDLENQIDFYRAMRDQLLPLAEKNQSNYNPTKITNNFTDLLISVGQHINQLEKQLDPTPQLLKEIEELRSEARSIGLEIQDHKGDYTVYIDKLTEISNDIHVRQVQINQYKPKTSKTSNNSKSQTKKVNDTPKNQDSPIATQKDTKKELQPTKVQSQATTPQNENKGQEYVYENQTAITDSKGNIKSVILGGKYPTYVPSLVNKLEVTDPFLRDIVERGHGQLTTVQVKKLTTFGYGAINNSVDWQILNSPDQLKRYGFELNYEIK